jgi:tetratricopeptide (TPR) repeat protein
MVAAAPDALPRAADPAALLAAAAALERVDARAAERAYAALTRREPALYGAWFGLGNARYATRDLEGARLAFVRATEVDADTADAWNNLAWTESALGRADAARAAALRAISLGGPRAVRYRETLAAIERTAR